MSSSRSFKVLLPIGILLIGFISVALMMKFRPTPQRRAGELPRPLVQVFQVTDTNEPARITGFGTVHAKRTITLVPQVSGRIVGKAAMFETGAFFAEHDVLVSIDPVDYQLAVQRAEAEVARATFNLARADEEAQVAQREWTEIHGSDDPASSLALHEPQLNLARADLAAAEAALARSRIDLERCSITAPFAGRVLAEAVDTGQYIRAGSQIGTIYATDVAEITVPIPDADLAWIDVPQSPLDTSSGSPVTIVAEFAGAVYEWSGQAVRIAGAVDSRSRLVPIVVEVADPYVTTGDRPPLVEGMFVEAHFIGKSPQGAVTIPRIGLRPGNRVWVINDDQTIAIREVSVARAGIDRAVINGGLASGETICVSNLQYVTNGMQIRVPGTGGQAK